MDVERQLGITFAGLLLVILIVLSECVYVWMLIQYCIDIDPVLCWEYVKHTSKEECIR